MSAVRSESGEHARRAIEVQARKTGRGWSCRVTISERGSQSRHDVTVSTDDLARLAPAAADPIELMRTSFEFLLEREPKESILATFDLPVIGRYFPDYEPAIRRRIARTRRTGP